MQNRTPEAARPQCSLLLGLKNARENKPVKNMETHYASSAVRPRISMACSSWNWLV